MPFVSILSFHSGQHVHYIDTHLCTLTSFLPCRFCFFLLQLVHRQTQLSCTIHSLTSMHAHLDRAGLESIVFSETNAVMLLSCNHTPSAMELRNRSAKRMTGQIQKQTTCPTSKCCRFFSPGQIPLHDDRWQADNLCHFMSKAVSR